MWVYNDKLTKVSDVRKTFGFIRFKEELVNMKNKATDPENSSSCFGDLTGFYNSNR